MRTTDLPLGQRARFSAFFVADHFFGRARVDRVLGARRRRLHEEICTHLQERGEGELLPIDRVPDLEPAEFFARYGKPGRPVVFTDVAARWRSHQWSLDALGERFAGDDVLLVKHEVYGDAVPASTAAPDVYEHTTLREFIDHVLAGGRRYARFHPLLDRHPELRAEMDQRWLSSHMYGKTARWLDFHTLFLGGAGTRTPIHAAGNDNLFLMAHGRKRWHLWPSQHLYVFDPVANRGPAKHCDLDPSAPDYDRYPAYRHLDTWTVDLEPGELLYVPAYTWHHVENLTPSVGVGVRWTAAMNSFRRSPLLASMEFLNTNPSMLSTFFLRGEFDFNKLILLSLGHKAHVKERARLEARAQRAGRA